MTNPNDYISPTTMRQIGQNEYRAATPREIQEGIYLSHKPGLTKREYFAVHTTEPLPSSFCQKYIRKKEEKEGGKRMTAGNYYEILTPEERIEVRALWRVKCADALINALNQQ